MEDKLRFIKEYVETISDTFSPVDFEQNRYRAGVRETCEKIIKKIEQVQKGGLIKNSGGSDASL